MERFGSWLCIHSGLLARIFRGVFETLNFLEAIFRAGQDQVGHRLAFPSFCLAVISVYNSNSFSRRSVSFLKQRPI